MPFACVSNAAARARCTISGSSDLPTGGGLDTIIEHEIENGLSRWWFVTLIVSRTPRNDNKPVCFGGDSRSRFLFCPLPRPPARKSRGGDRFCVPPATCPSVFDCLAARAASLLRGSCGKVSRLNAFHARTRATEHFHGYNPGDLIAYKPPSNDLVSHTYSISLMSRYSWWLQRCRAPPSVSSAYWPPLYRWSIPSSQRLWSIPLVFKSHYIVVHSQVQLAEN
jgi:hypothetical protein